MNDNINNNNNNNNAYNDENTNNSPKIQCIKCNTIFQHKSSLRRHLKKCDKITTVSSSKEIVEDTTRMHPVYKKPRLKGKERRTVFTQYLIFGTSI
jgi:hypothetical protein